MNLNKIADNFAATCQLQPQDVALAKAQGFSTIICNRPDGEEYGQPTSEMIRAACVDNEIEFHYVPMSPAGPGPHTLSDFKAAVAGSKGKILGYCRSGARSAMLWKSTR